MKRKYLVIGGFTCLHLFARAQQPKDSVREKLSKTEIELVYNQYMQNGNNSAITGGTGTEKMSVYGPSLHINKMWNNNSLGVVMGSDIISSASVDNIDFVTSASRVDARTYITSNYARNINSWKLSGGVSASIESDYTSLGTSVGIAKRDKVKLRDYSLLFGVYHDDLRWGRLNNQTNHKPERLIYPVELRNSVWYDSHKRNSYSLKAAASFAVNRRNRLGFFGEFGYQEGLLSTPFHRIYFNNDSLAVEQLPSQRFKGTMGARWNTFLAGRVILRNGINVYADSWDIASISFENETVIKISRILNVIPNLRFYTQNGSSYFRKYGAHNPDDKYHTSDFDLSALYAFDLGIGMKFSPSTDMGNGSIFNTIKINYNYYKRNDGLTAHFISTSFLFKSK